MDFIYEPNQIFSRNAENKLLAEVTFPAVDERTVEINHTFVDSSLQGQGIAGQLVYAAAEYLRRQNKKVIPTCSYAVAWFQKHPEYKDILFSEEETVEV